MKRDRKTGFGANLWGTWQIVESDAVVVFDEVKTDDQRNIQGVDFQFVAQEEFRKTYTVI